MEFGFVTILELIISALRCKLDVNIRSIILFETKGNTYGKAKIILGESSILELDIAFECKFCQEN